MPITPEPNPQNSECNSCPETINQNLLAFEKEIREILSNQIDDYHLMLAFIKHWLIKYSIHQCYQPKDIFLEAYYQIRLEVMAGKEIQDTPASMKRKSLEIIRQCSKNNPRRRL